MTQKLAIIALGKPNSGKSNTWYEIFGRVIRSGWKTLKISNNELNLFVKNSSFEETNEEINIDIFVRNASFEEYGDEIENSLSLKKLPSIVMCSVQYTEKGIKTIDWFRKHNYYIYIQWINPGYKHQKEYSDSLNFEETFKNFGEFHKITGKEKANRAKTIKIFLANWKTQN